MSRAFLPPLGIFWVFFQHSGFPLFLRMCSQNVWCAALEIISAAISPKLGENAVIDFAKSFSTTFSWATRTRKGAKKNSTKARKDSAANAQAEPTPPSAEFSRLDDILPTTCPGQPELAQQLMHAAYDVATGAVAAADGAVEADQDAELAGNSPMHASHARVSLQNGLKEGKRGMRGRGKAAPVQGGSVSESQEEGVSDDEGGVRWGAKEEQDAAVRDHLRGPRCVVACCILA